jgi:DNA-binding XRE family transcriptional regulator
MNYEEFSRIRHYLDKTQSELAGLLCVSTKAIQSFEQGWLPMLGYAKLPH